MLSLNIGYSDSETFVSLAIRLLLKLQIECYNKLYNKCLKIDLGSTPVFREKLNSGVKQNI